MKTSNGISPKDSSVNMGFKSFSLQIVNSRSIWQSAIIISVLTFMLYFKLSFQKRTSIISSKGEELVKCWNSRTCHLLMAWEFEDPRVLYKLDKHSTTELLICFFILKHFVC